MRALGKNAFIEAAKGRARVCPPFLLAERGTKAEHIKKVGNERLELKVWRIRRMGKGECKKGKGFYP